MINIHKVFSIVSGMKSGLVLLILIGVSSALGSIIAPSAFYRFWGFQLLLLLLLINMTICSVRSLVPILKPYTITRINRRRYPGRFDLLFIHVGIIAILWGAIINAFYGQIAQIAILEGSRTDSSKALTSQYPFIMQLDEFKVDFNPDGSPEQYYSNVSLLENGSVKAEGAISVNHPLQYKGFKFYQQDYGYMVKLRYIDDEGREAEDLLSEDSTKLIPGTNRVLHVLQYAPDFDPDKGLNQTPGNANNPRIIFSVSENNKLLGIGAAKFGEKINIESNIAVIFTGVQPYSILMIKSTPGLSLVLAGGIIFLCGLVLTLLPGFVKNNSRRILAG